HYEKRVQHYIWFERKVFLNDSDMDALVFIEDLYALKEHFYIRAHESYMISEPNISISGFLRVVYGEGWASDQYELPGSYPGFQFLWGVELKKGYQEMIRCAYNSEGKINRYHIKLNGAGEVTTLEKRATPPE
ncbi:MAG: hypothetical protein AAFV80_04730, partial [Bacteroidota bacterium]